MKGYEQMSRERRSREDEETNLIEAAKSGDRLETLIALRDLLAERLQTATSDRDISSMSRRLMQCVNEIDTLQNAKNNSNGWLLSYRNQVQMMKNNYKNAGMYKEHDG